MRDASHFGRDRRERLAPEMLVLGILGNVAAVPIPERVVALSNRDLRCTPERAPQTRISYGNRLLLFCCGLGCGRLSRLRRHDPGTLRSRWLLEYDKR